jgi:hypothetical protein
LFWKEPPTTTITTIPTGPEATIWRVRRVDPTLLAEITEARRRLEEISPEVIALLLEVAQLEERAFDAADAIAGQGADSWKTGEVDRVMEATGAGDLGHQAMLLAVAYPIDPAFETHKMYYG